MFSCGVHSKTHAETAETTVGQDFRCKAPVPAPRPGRRGYGAPQSGSSGNVTFSSVLFPKEGTWSLRVGASWVPFHVGPAPVAAFEAPRATALTIETTRADVAGDFMLASVTSRSGARLGASPLDLTVVEHEKADGSPADARDVDGLYRSGALGIP